MTKQAEIQKAIETAQIAYDAARLGVEAASIDLQNGNGNIDVLVNAGAEAKKLEAVLETAKAELPKAQRYDAAVILADAVKATPDLLQHIQTAVVIGAKAVTIRIVWPDGKPELLTVNAALDVAAPKAAKADGEPKAATDAEYDALIAKYKGIPTEQLLAKHAAETIGETTFGAWAAKIEQDLPRYKKPSTDAEFKANKKRDNANWQLRKSLMVQDSK